MTLVLGGAVVGLSHIDHVSSSAQPETENPFDTLKRKNWALKTIFNLNKFLQNVLRRSPLY